jgi:hypothetical protein
MARFPLVFFLFLVGKLAGCLVIENLRRSGGGSLHQEEKTTLAGSE